MLPAVTQVISGLLQTDGTPDPDTPLDEAPASPSALGRLDSVALPSEDAVPPSAKEENALPVSLPSHKLLSGVGIDAAALARCRSRGRLLNRSLVGCCASAEGDSVLVVRLSRADRGAAERASRYPIASDAATLAGGRHAAMIALYDAERRRLQVFDAQRRKRMKVQAMGVELLHWGWLRPDRAHALPMLSLVTPTTVFHWNVSPSANARPSKAAALPKAAPDFSAVRSYDVSRDHQWALLEEGAAATLWHLPTRRPALYRRPCAAAALFGRAGAARVALAEEEHGGAVSLRLLAPAPPPAEDAAAAPACEEMGAVRVGGGGGGGSAWQVVPLDEGLCVVAAADLAGGRLLVAHLGVGRVLYEREVPLEDGEALVEAQVKDWAEGDEMGAKEIALVADSGKVWRCLVDWAMLADHAVEAFGGAVGDVDVAAQLRMLATEEGEA